MTRTTTNKIMFKLISIIKGRFPLWYWSARLSKYVFQQVLPNASSPFLVIPGKSNRVNLSLNEYFLVFVCLSPSIHFRTRHLKSRSPNQENWHVSSVLMLMRLIQWIFQIHFEWTFFQWIAKIKRQNRSRIWWAEKEGILCFSRIYTYWEEEKENWYRSPKDQSG